MRNVNGFTEFFQFQLFLNSSETEDLFWNSLKLLYEFKYHTKKSSIIKDCLVLIGNGNIKTNWKVETASYWMENSPKFGESVEFMLDKSI